MVSIGLVLILLGICMSVDYATDYNENDTITVTNQTMDVKGITNATYLNGTHYALDNDSGIAKLHKVVVEKPKYPIVTITARPSCGCGKHYSYRWRTKSYISYCPHCHRYGVLYNTHKYQAKHEQELTCRHCGADYCGNCGKEKYSWSRYYLRRA